MCRELGEGSAGGEGGGGGVGGSKAGVGGERPFTAKLFYSRQCLVSFHSRFTPVSALFLFPGSQVCGTPRPFSFSSAAGTAVAD